MKNIHILPTDKPSRFVTSKENKKCYLYSIEEFKNIDKFIEYDSKSWDSQNIYITSDEEIKVGDWFYNSFFNEISKIDVLHYSNFRKKIILTDNKDLIKDGVQAIDDEFLEWFVNNPNCEEVETVFNNRGITGAEKILKTFGEYKIIIPKEEPKQENCCTPVGQIKRYLNCVGCDRKPKQETLEEVAKKMLSDNKHKKATFETMIEFAKWQQERMYSEEDLKYAFDSGRVRLTFDKERPFVFKNYEEFIEQFKNK